MKLTSLYEELLTGKSVLIQATAETAQSITAQLRVIKSRYEAKYNSLSGQSLSEGLVIRCTPAPLTKDTYIYSLDKNKRISKLNFEILNIEEVNNTIGSEKVSSDLGTTEEVR